MTEKTNQILDLEKPQTYRISFNFSPKHELFDLDASSEEITRAVSEADFIASVLKHELVTDELAETVRGFLFASCLYLAESLEYYKAHAQMIVDVYPYARLVKREELSRHFASFFLEIQETAPELFQSLAEVKSDN